MTWKVGHLGARRVVIVGAGPAGLAASAALAERGVDGLIIDGGPALDARSQHDPTTILSGPGGAGLFSDGKFSFFPSASGLWHIEPRELLEEGWGWFSALLAPLGVRVPALPVADALALADSAQTGTRKRYDSVYVGPAERYQLIRSLMQAGLPLRTSTQVSSLSLGRGRLEARGEADELVLPADAMVLATGRFGPLALDGALADSQGRFERVEIGVRIEQAADDFFLRGESQLDPKIIYSIGDVEYRTFCCCRDGIVAVTEFDGLRSVSGRADGPPSGRSNVGFNVRVRDEDSGLCIWEDVRQRLVSAELPVTEPLETFLAAGGILSRSPLSAVLGSKVAGLLRTGLLGLMREYGPVALERAVLVGPSIEGVGRYPRIGPDLRLADTDVWVAGDLAGIFRGLTAAMVSGYVAGLAAADWLSTDGRQA